ncbi:MAG: hypothetical protein Q8O24_03360 [Gallionellaceae bacterium]|nr:hypothetical protein [Gallionellaceae bacterium]
MSNNVTQPEEIDMVLKEFSDFFAKSESEIPQTRKPKTSKELSDDEYYIPLYKASYFN